jgi:hypothetical protein
MGFEMTTNQQIQYFINYFHNIFNTREFHINNFYEYATESDWSKIPYFSKKYESDNWGEHTKIRLGILLLVSGLREIINYPIQIISGTGGQHKSNSYHYKGMAADCYCRDLSLLDFYLKAEMIPFSGIGIYPNMNTLHLDIGVPDKRPARWIGMKNRQQKNIDYFIMNDKNFKKYVISKKWAEKYRK